jgi:hypothetical protein
MDKRMNSPTYAGRVEPEVAPVRGYPEGIRWVSSREAGKNQISTGYEPSLNRVHAL